MSTSQQRPILPASKPSTSSSIESKKPSSSNTSSINSTSSKLVSLKTCILRQIHFNLQLIFRFQHQKLLSKKKLKKLFLYEKKIKKILI